MKVIIHDVKIDGENPFCLIPVSDVHIGHVDHDKNFAQKTISWIAKKGASVILLGDMIDGICPKDLRFENNSIADEFKVHLDNLHHKQTEALLKLISPIKKEKVIAVMGGNHEETVKKYYSYDATQVIAEALKRPALPDPSYVVLRFDHSGSKRLIKIFCTHGQFLGGRKRGGKINRMEDLAADHDADLYLAGHTHDIWETRTCRTGVSTKGKYEKQRKRFINTGSFMDTYLESEISTWGSRKLFSPIDPGVARIDFYAKKRQDQRYIDIHVRI
jgi:UDP-2,3-diacylglucosamine pyrophosphatase LpxH